MTPEAWASVIVACVMAVGSIAVAIITTRRHGAAIADNTAKTDQVLHQVQNDHQTNLRDDLDALRKETMDALDRVEAAQGMMGGIVGQITKDVREVTKDVREAIRHGKEHDVASAWIVQGLRARDEALAQELHRYHPPPDQLPPA